MRISRVNRGTLWLYELRPFKNHGKFCYCEQYRGHVSRKPKLVLKLMGLAWEWFGIKQRR